MAPAPTKWCGSTSATLISSVKKAKYGLKLLLYMGMLMYCIWRIFKKIERFWKLIFGGKVLALHPIPCSVLVCGGSYLFALILQLSTWNWQKVIALISFCRLWEDSCACMAHLTQSYQTGVSCWEQTFSSSTVRNCLVRSISWLTLTNQTG
jgi:hypothetical protein